MDKSFYTAYVGREIADLIPTYLANRHKEVEQLNRSLEANDFAAMGVLAHRMVGVGTPYGFSFITDLAKLIREAAASQQTDLLAELIKEYREYLNIVKIVFK